MPFTVEGTAIADRVEKPEFQVSYDEGRTWTTAKGVDGSRLSVKHPAEPGTG
ncbi:hypothetical protein [Streptomyces sp. WM6386]|uniref:hypothetical protein n=1 Tax=Streptomyces sp. WM6386 TaxID=1415558 RepID=UPI000A888825|nr:hypothetical protein [Streptomyces sp. WM6386]